MTYGYGIKYNLGRGQFGVSPIVEPCLTNISQWFGATYEDTGLYYQTDKTNPVVPISLKSGIVQLNGVDNGIDYNIPLAIIPTITKIRLVAKTTDQKFVLFNSGGSNYIGALNGDDFYGSQVNIYSISGAEFTNGSKQELIIDNCNLSTWTDISTNYGNFLINGEIYEIEFYDVNNNTIAKYVFGEGSGSIIYDKTGNNHGTILGTLSSVWQTSELQRPNNFLDGYNVGINGEFVPADSSNLGFDVLGDALVYAGIGKTGTGHNICETTYVLEHYGELAITELINHIEVGVRIFFKLTKVGETIMKVDKIVTYDPNVPAPTGTCLADTLKYVSMYFFMFNLMITENTINYLTLI